ncbi:hypothetical protein D3C74_411170 [compost metagenome]
MNLIHAKLPCNCLAYRFGIAGQHDRFVYAELFERLNRKCCIFLHFISNYEMPNILSGCSYMHNSPYR